MASRSNVLQNITTDIILDNDSERQSTETFFVLGKKDLTQVLELMETIVMEVDEVRNESGKASCR